MVHWKLWQIEARLILSLSPGISWAYEPSLDCLHIQTHQVFSDPGLPDMNLRWTQQGEDEVCTSGRAGKCGRYVSTHRPPFSDVNTQRSKERRASSQKWKSRPETIKCTGHFLLLNGLAVIQGKERERILHVTCSHSFILVV